MYDGWIEVESQLLGEYGQSEPTTVPILVGRQDNQEYPIIGFNVIEEVVKQGSISDVKARSLVNFMQVKEKESDTGVIRVGKNDVHLAPGETIQEMLKQESGGFCKG